MMRTRTPRLLFAGVVATALVGVSATTAATPAGQQLKSMRLPVADVRVIASWQLPDGLTLAGYGPELAGRYAAFALNYVANVTRYPAGTHAKYGVIDLNTGRLRFFESSFDGGTTGVLIGGLGRFLRVENTGSADQCSYGPGNCLPWAIVDTDPASLASRVIDRGVSVNDSVMAPRPVAGPDSFAWQRTLPDGSNEIVEWRPGKGAPKVIGRAASQGELVHSAQGWLLATMWGRGPTLADVASGRAIESPPLAGIAGDHGSLVWATQIKPTALDRPGTTDVFVGKVTEGRLVGRKIARVPDLYGLGWVGIRHVLVGTPLGISLVPTGGGSISPLPAVPDFIARADGQRAVLFVPGDRGEIGVAAIEAN